jgi:hypothetical protein
MGSTLVGQVLELQTPMTELLPATCGIRLTDIIVEGVPVASVQETSIRASTGHAVEGKRGSSPTPIVEEITGSVANFHLSRCGV